MQSSIDVTGDEERGQIRNRRDIAERVAHAEKKAIDARKNAQIAQARVNNLKRESGKAERKKRAHLLIQMGAAIQNVGCKDIEDVHRLLGLLRGWTFTDRAGEKKSVLDDAIAKTCKAGSNGSDGS